jgi:hypothetical protein
VNALKGKPATYGWYVADEPSGGSADGPIIELNNRIKALDPAHPTIAVVGWWELRVGFCGSNLAHTGFLDRVADYADILAIDYYPLDTDGDGTPGPTCEQDDMAAIISAGYGWAKARGRKWGLVLQGYSPSVAYHCGTDQTTWPTVEQMQLWRDIGMMNSRPDFILWYSYFDVRWYAAQQSDPQIDRMQAAAFAWPAPRMPA